MFLKKEKLFKAHINDAENHSGASTIINTNDHTAFHYKLLSKDDILPRSFQVMDNKMNYRYLPDLFQCSTKIIDRSRNDTPLSSMRWSQVIRD